jgi:DNA ligase 1
MQSKVFPILYDTDRMGRIRVYQLTVTERDDLVGVIEINYGLIDGTRQTETIIVSEGKNLGKSNETTPYNQAIADAQSKWNLKRDKGYRLDQYAEAVKKGPMLAQKFQERSHYITYPCFIQPKLNGMRCLAYAEDGSIRFMSRGGKPIQSIPHIEKELLSMMADGDIFDGELYAHGHPLQDIISAIKNIDHPEKSAFPLAQVQYWVYDYPDLESKLTFNERENKLNARFFKKVLSSVLQVKTVPVDSVDEINEIHIDFRNEGFEGIIIRNFKGTYAWDERSNDLQKLKLMQDAEFEIVGVKEGTGRSAGLGCFQCITADGKRFDANPEGTADVKREYLINATKYIGKKLTVRFQELSKDGIPLFPVGVAVRDYE